MKLTVDQSALSMVEKYGWYVFRVWIDHDLSTCDDGSASCKDIRPLGKWKQISSNDLEVVAGWDWSAANAYGIDCEKSGIAVADEDPGASWPLSVDTLTFKTGRGKHYVYQDLIGCATDKGVAPWGIDVRGIGGMIIGPGSWHPHGSYEVLVDAPMLAAPIELMGRAAAGSGWDGRSGAYAGAEYADLAPGLQAFADREQRARVNWWAAKMAVAAEWAEGERDEDGRGWEALTRDLAWALALMAVCPWMAMDADDAGLLFDLLLPPELAGNHKCQGKWSDRTLANAALEPVDLPTWDDFAALASSVYDDGVVRVPVRVDVTNESAALDWLKPEVGRGQLAGIFLRGGDLVHTPQVGESGYVSDDRFSAGPAQVQRIEALQVAGRVDDGYLVVKGRRPKSCMFPLAVASRALANPDLLPGVRTLAGVTHTPLVRADGTVLDSPGYDEASRALYLPLPGLVVPPVPDRPSAHELARARALLLSMIADFPFVTVHDRANYLGALLTPLLRALVPPPYKMLAIGAPQRGSGKSLLAWIMRELHGGVFKSEFPGDDAEIRKVITSVLDITTGPVVQFDNVTGVLKSSVLDGLLTSVSWSDRLLGRSQMVTLDNDRLWVVTGNNVHIGGDLERRTMWVTINADLERPEERSDFGIMDLEGWVKERRGELLWALLVLVRSWAVAGMVVGPQPTSDSFGRWIAVLRGILKHAGIVGVVGHAETAQAAREDPEDVEWRVFLAAAHRVFREDSWTCRQLLEKVSDFEGGLASDELPGDLSERMEKGHVSLSAVARSLGIWLGNRENRWAGGYVVKGFQNGDRAKEWRVVPKAS